MRCSNMAAEFKKGEKPGRYPSRYGALYRKVHTTGPRSIDREALGAD